MKYLSIDIETGGLTTDYSLLEVGMIADELSDPGHRLDKVRLVIINEHMVVNPGVLDMHKALFGEIYCTIKAGWWQQLVNDGYTYGFIRPGDEDSHEFLKDATCYCTSEGAPVAFRFLLDKLGFDWKNGPITAAGKNAAGFDIPFMSESGLLASSEEMIEQLDDKTQAISEAAMKGYPAVHFRHRVLDPCTLYMRRDDSMPPNLATCLERAGLKPTASHTALGDALDVVRLLHNSPTFMVR